MGLCWRSTQVCALCDFGVALYMAVEETRRPFRFPIAFCEGLTTGPAYMESPAHLNPSLERLASCHATPVSVLQVLKRSSQNQAGQSLGQYLKRRQRPCTKRSLDSPRHCHPNLGCANKTVGKLSSMAGHSQYVVAAWTVS